MIDLAEVERIFKGSDAKETIGLYQAIEATGPLGAIAVNLLRAAKKSERAKKYRGKYKGASYDGKQWAMGRLCDLLPESHFVWGWAIDEKMRSGSGDPHYHVLYIDLPSGQVSFHTGARGQGPDYPLAWDGVRGAGAGRICRWAAYLLGDEKAYRRPSPLDCAPICDEAVEAALDEEVELRRLQMDLFA